MFDKPFKFFVSFSSSKNLAVYLPFFATESAVV
jgi:hypothetical protein